MKIKNKMKTEQELRKIIKNWLIVFIVFLLLSGITAFPIEIELSFLAGITAKGPVILSEWIIIIYDAVKKTNLNYPFLAYGTDWLAFAHIVIAMAFWGPLKDPVRNIWVVQFGMIACMMVIPLALICGSIRNIPVFWQLIDCSFGVFGFIPLFIIYRNIQKLEQITHT